MKPAWYSLLQQFYGPWTVRRVIWTIAPQLEQPDGTGDSCVGQTCGGEL
jgi:hypothetical protein